MNTNTDQPKTSPQNIDPLSVLEDYFETLLHEQEQEEPVSPVRPVPPVRPVTAALPETLAPAAQIKNNPNQGTTDKHHTTLFVAQAAPAPTTQHLPEHSPHDNALVLEAHRRNALQRLLNQQIDIKVAQESSPLAITAKTAITEKKAFTEKMAVAETRAVSEKKGVVEKAVAAEKNALPSASIPQIKTETHAASKSEPPGTTAPVIPAGINEIQNKAAQKTESAAAIPAQIEPLLQWGDNGRPLWAKDSFDILLFNVSGLTLAVPLVALGHIVDFSQDKLKYLHGRSSWFMGILPSSVGELRIVNTALFVMPEKYNEKFLSTAEYVVTIHGLPWGLMVDSVKQPVRLQPDDVKWRSERSKRPWLAGTVKSLMCALIDIPQLAEILKNPQP